MTRPRTPLLTADVVIALVDRRDAPIVLIRRRHPPLGWALPGGFVEIGETVEQAATREALEETGLAVELTGLLGCYSEPDRDPRGHTASVVFTATASGTPRAGDDAGEVATFQPKELPLLVFDHAKILEDYFAQRLSPSGQGL